MSEEDKFINAIRWFTQMALGAIWFLILANKLDKIIKLLEGK